MVTTESPSVTERVTTPREPVRSRARAFVEAHPAFTTFVVLFVAFAATLLWKNHHLFSVAIHEDGDSAANAILIEKAKHFDLLVGNYSRQMFSHPGPADFYVEGAGEALFHDATGVVPTAYNGQAVALVLLNSGLLALALTIIGVHVRSRLALAGCFAVTIAFGSAHTQLISSTWMPWVYFAPFLLLIVAGASVARGEYRHLWCLALAGGLLVHGHVEFFLFVPVIAIVAIAILFLTGKSGIKDAIVQHRNDWIAFVAVVALFVLPIALNVLLHWPGEFGKYWHYSQSDKAGGHSLGTSLEYLGWFWPNDASGHHVLIVVASLAAVVFAVVARNRRERSFVRMLLVFCVVATALFLVYIVRGVDDVSERYIGYFYWAVPLTVLLVATIGLCTVLRSSRAGSIVAMIAFAAVFALALRGVGLQNTYRGDPQLPTAVDTMAERAGNDHSMVLEIDTSSWPDALGVLVESDRTGRRACMADPSWEFMVTARFVCSPTDLSNGTTFEFRTPGSDAADAEGGVVVRMPLSDVSVAGTPVAAGR
jgi:hypothetical protein